MDLRTELTGWESDHPARNRVARLFGIPKIMILLVPNLIFLDILENPILENQILENRVLEGPIENRILGIQSKSNY